MRSTILREDGERTHLLVFEPGETVVEALVEFTRSRGIGAARLSGIGAVQEAELGYFNPDRKDYDRWVVEHAEMLSFLGNLTILDGEPRVHAHAVLGLRDGTAVGGHLFECRCGPTLELFVTEWPGRTLERRMNDAVGLPLVEP